MDSVSDRFSISDSIVLLLLVMSIYVSTVLPKAFVFLDFVYYVQFVLLLCFFAFWFDVKMFESGISIFSLFKISFIIVLAFFLFSSFFANIEINSSFKAIFKILSYLVLLIILFYYFSRKILLNPVLFEKFLNFLLAVGIFVALFALVAFFAGIRVNKTFYAMATGFFMHPNTVSNFYTILIPVLFYKYFSKKITLPVFISLFILLSIALLFTFSRAGYLGTCVAILIITFSKSKKFFFASLIILFLTIYLVVSEFAAVKSDSSITRAFLWVTAADMITRDMHHMLWGYGPFHALEVFQSEKFFFGSREMVPDPHNSILLFSIQYGLVFTASLTVFIILTYFYIFLKRKTEYYKQNKLKIFLCIAVTAGLTIQNMLENILVYPEFYVMQFYLIFFGIMFNFILLVGQNE